MIILDNDLLNKYKQEMLSMYRPTKATPTASESPSQPSSTPTGKLLGIVTTVRELYPVENAKVTVFTGAYNNMQVIDSATTDQSGRTKFFILPTPQKSLSLEQSNTILPYATYNMMVEADGYIKNVHLNIPVFASVTSLQQSNLILEETAGQNKGPQIFDESQKYDL